MRTETKTWYKLDELPEDVKPKALDSVRYSSGYLDYEWWDTDVEEWTEKLEGLGYVDVEIAFSGFSSQGDGASFTAQVNLAKWLKAHKLAGKNRALYNYCLSDGCYPKIYRSSSHYSHENTVSLETNTWGMSDKPYDQLCALEDEIMEISRGYMQDIYRGLEAEYYGLMEDDVVADAAMANEWHFDEQGHVEWRCHCH